MIPSFLRTSLLLASVMPILPGSLSLEAQQGHSVSVGVNYTYVRTNLVPSCNCFHLNGGGAEVQVDLRSRLSLVGDLTATHAGDITANHYDLTQITYIGGLRYSTALRRHLLPFGDVLVGGAHTSGTLSPGVTGFGSSNAFAFQTGGGLGVPLGERWTLVPFRAAYMLTTFSNGQADRQNDLRLSAGLRFRLSK